MYVVVLVVNILRASKLCELLHSYVKTHDYHQQRLAKVFKIMTWEASPYYIVMLHGKDLDTPNVTVVVILHVHPWFIHSLEKSSLHDIEVRLCDIWK